MAKIWSTYVETIDYINNNNNIWTAKTKLVIVTIYSV